MKKKKLEVTQEELAKATQRVVVETIKEQISPTEVEVLNLVENGKENSDIPSNPLERNSYGLIKGVQYVYDTDGRVNWRKMVNPKYLVPNKSVTDEIDITKLEDNKLLITLAGIRNLAQIRGYASVVYNQLHVTERFVSVRCQIHWVGNYESGNDVLFEALADATPESTRGFAMNYLSAIAENRAFTRCVRNFLNINIVGEEEVGGGDNAGPIVTSAPTGSPQAVLVALMAKKNITFENIKAKLVEQKLDKVEEVNTIEQIPLDEVFKLIKRLNDYSV